MNQIPIIFIHHWLTSILFIILLNPLKLHTWRDYLLVSFWGYIFNDIVWRIIGYTVRQLEFITKTAFAWWSLLLKFNILLQFARTAIRFVWKSISCTHDTIVRFERYIVAIFVVLSRILKRVVVGVCLDEKADMHRCCDRR